MPYVKTGYVRKMSNEFVRSARVRYAAKQATAKKLAREAGVSRQSMLKALAGVTFRHVEFPTPIEK